MQNQHPTAANVSRRGRSWQRFVVPIVITILPLIIGAATWFVRSSPLRSDISIASSVPGGRHHAISGGLADGMKGLNQRRTVRMIETQGSLANLRLLQFGLVDFGMYQAGTDAILIEQEFQQLDQSGQSGESSRPDGFLSIDEFSREYLGQGFDDSESNLSRVFDELDRDNNGLLSVEEFDDTSSLRFVANLYSEVTHIIVLNSSGLNDDFDLRGKRVALGQEYSGDYASSRLILDHCSVSLDEIERFPGDIAGPPPNPGAGTNYYSSLTRAFEQNELDCAIVTVGLHAESVATMLRQLGTHVSLVEVPHAKGMISKHVGLTHSVIPAGAYWGLERDVQTVSLQAQLLTHDDVDERVVQQMTALILSSSFQKRNQLGELYRLNQRQRVDYARSLPEFEIHHGAGEVYNDEEFDPEQFQNWEAMYSLVASIGIGIFFGGRWLIQRHHANQERLRIEMMSAQKEELDKFLERTMEIEELQMHERNVQRLKELLDRVTNIKLEALSELTHEDLRGDRTFSIFLMQCANLISKIQFKLLLESSYARRDEPSAGD